MWAISIDAPEVVGAERRLNDDLVGTFLSAPEAELERVGLLHQTRTKVLASPATILLRAGSEVAWTHYSSQVGDRASIETIADQVRALGA